VFVAKKVFVAANLTLTLIFWRLQSLKCANWTLNPSYLVPPISLLTSQIHSNFIFKMLKLSNSVELLTSTFLLLQIDKVMMKNNGHSFGQILNLLNWLSLYLHVWTFNKFQSCIVWSMFNNLKTDGFRQCEVWCIIYNFDQVIQLDKT
jgi:hypothetical protein